MTKIILKIKNKHYEFEIQKSEEFLILLDKFLKRNKIDRSEIDDLKADFSLEKSLISKRIILTTIKTIKLAREVN
ncbi:MAG TPA: hypothetical protein PL164_00650 [Candidatus Paceibacterota bacterium]|nr:hypothetical protein [Candidatus Paceibacterota bacterium]HPP64723.1 hypothetical protein [Candidatus Paceibacterota bacterium]